MEDSESNKSWKKSLVSIWIVLKLRHQMTTPPRKAQCLSRLFPPSLVMEFNELTQRAFAIYSPPSYRDFVWDTVLFFRSFDLM